MSSQKSESDNKQIQNKSNNPSQQQKEQQQSQQIAEHTIATTATISKTTNEVTNRNNENQKINKAILDKSIDITNRYQQQIIKAIKVSTDNYNLLQNNIVNTYQSTFSKFINYTSDDNNKSYNFAALEQLKMYNKINQNMIDNAINTTRTTHELLTGYIDIFNKSIELGQEYYSDGIKNYFKFGKKIERT